MNENTLAKEESIRVANQQPLPRKWRTVIAFVSLSLWIFFMLLVWVFLRTLRPQKLEGGFKAFHRGCAWHFGIGLTVKGEIATHRPTLFVANHISYLDVFIYGAVIPGYFIAKAEVGSWPVLGWLARIQNTLFFERNSRSIKGQLKVMTEHFNRKGNLILFPEGTSTEGMHVEPFKSSLLQSVEITDADVMIQPVTLAYTHYRGKPMNQSVRDFYAWYGNMKFIPHFFNALGMGKSHVVVHFHQPVRLKDFGCRKDCTNYCQRQVADNLSLELDAVS